MTTLPAFLWDIDPTPTVHDTIDPELHQVLHAWWSLPHHPEGAWICGEWLCRAQGDYPRFRMYFMTDDHWIPTLFPKRFTFGHRVYGIVATGLTPDQAYAIHTTLIAQPTYLGMRTDADSLWAQRLGQIDVCYVRADALAVPCRIHTTPRDLFGPFGNPCDPLPFYVRALESIAPIVAYHPHGHIDSNC